jgi:hypothetical protein
MGCGCKNDNNTNGQIPQGEEYNVLGNTIVRILLMVIIIVITPLIIPVIWYMSYIQIFKNGKGFDLYPGIKALFGKLMSKKDDKEYDDDIDINGVDIDDLELVTQVDEVDKDKGK